jgi:antitoxin (DNA-binding transcriptional repressor) of toxin-antitoxin stability system
MTITQTVDIPADRRITLEVPREVPVGRTILAFTPVKAKQKKERGFGCAKGQFKIADDFDAPLEDFKDYM